MKKTVKSVSTLLCAAMLAGLLLPSCGEAPASADETADTTPTAAEEVVEAAAEEEEPAHEFPEKDMEGATITILVRLRANQHGRHSGGGIHRRRYERLRA